MTHARSLLAPLLLLPALAAAGEPVPSEWVARWRADLETACREIPLRHPDPFERLPRDEFERSCRMLGEDAPTLSHSQLVVRLAGLVARIEDGHSRLTLPLEPGSGFFTGHTETAAPKIPTFRHYPIRLARLQDGFVVSRAAAALDRLLGARLTAIGGRPVSEAEAAIAPIVNHDNPHQVRDLLPMFLVLPEVLAARRVVESEDGATFAVIRRDGVEETVALQPVARGAAVEWRTLETSVPPPRDRRHPERKHWIEPLDGGATIYARLAEVADGQDQTLESFASRLEAEIRKDPTRRLVLDLRGNPGGNNELNAPLVRALVRAERLWEPGGLFVITDGGTFSAAMNLATQLERLTPAIFAGSGTGGRPNHFGDARKIVLPETGLTLRISSLYWQDSGPGDTRDAIEPLLPAEPTVADFLAGRDPALDAILALDRPPAAAAGVWQGRAAVGHRQVSLTLVLRAEGDGEVRLPDLGVGSAPLVSAARSGNVVRGRVRLATVEAPIAVRLGGDKAAGWLDYRGRYFPFVAARQP